MHPRTPHDRRWKFRHVRLSGRACSQPAIVVLPCIVVIQYFLGTAEVLPPVLRAALRTATVVFFFAAGVGAAVLQISGAGLSSLSCSGGCLLISRDAR